MTKKLMKCAECSEFHKYSLETVGGVCGQCDGGISWDAKDEIECPFKDEFKGCESECPKCLLYGTSMQFHICNPYNNNECQIFIPVEEGKELSDDEIVTFVKAKLIERKEGVNIMDMYERLLSLALEVKHHK